MTGDRTRLEQDIGTSTLRPSFHSALLHCVRWLQPLTTALLCSMLLQSIRSSSSDDHSSQPIQLSGRHDGLSSQIRRSTRKSEATHTTFHVQANSQPHSSSPHREAKSLWTTNPVAREPPKESTTGRHKESQSTPQNPR